MFQKPLNPTTRARDQTAEKTLTPEAWQRIKALFAEASQLDSAARETFLARECGSDPTLRAEIESLLACAQNGSGFLEMPAAPRLDLEPGTRLGDYEVLSLLGPGGMGGAYRARDLRLRRDVAIKVLPATLSSDTTSLRRFDREARAAASLNHPHIVTIHSIEHVGEVHLIVMELVDGQTLDRVIPGGGLSLEKLMGFAEGLADGVAAAHEKGIIHRDLKPGNIMVDRRGSIKILDFGIAKLTDLVDPGALDLESPTYWETEAGMVIGTVPYMSPEQLLGKKVDCRTDIFSLGVVFYQMATGQRPFHGESRAELASAILRDKPKAIIELRADLPRSLQGILERCLAKEVEDRCASAELCDAIQRLRRELVSGRRFTACETPEASVAVLPFLNMSADPENEFFADGITEEIINALAQIKQLHVAARTSSLSFKGKHVDLRIIGERLNVEAVLQGSIRRSGNHLRITVQLVNVADGYHLWSEKYDREMKDVFEIQDEISRSIAERLKISLESKQPLVKAGTENLEAYQLYLKGRALFFQRGPRLRRALECFERAVALDPKYALAWSGTADARNMVSFYGLLPPEACVKQAKDAAERAVSLDPSLAEAHTALALSYLFVSDPARCESEFLRALELNPRYSQARSWYGMFYLHWGVGRTEEGIDQLKQAVEADPLSAYARAMLAICCCDAGRTEEALHTAKAAVELDPDSFITRWFLQVALQHQRRFEESVAAGEVALALSGRHPYCLGSLALAYADWGKVSEAQSLYMELVWRAKRDYVQLPVLAWAASAAGDQEAAIQFVREAYQRHDPSMLAAARYSAFARLRQDARFRAMIEASVFK